MPRLRSLKGHLLTLPPRRVSVGESAVNEIPIAPGNGVAGVHFHLQPWESGCFLEDAGSGLGTMVNDKRVTWAPLKHGDRIAAGDLTMIYESADGPGVPDFPARTRVDLEVVAALPPPPAGESAQPPAWLPPEALLPPVPPLAQAAARTAAAEEKKSPRRMLTAVLLCAAAAVAAAWYFFIR